LLHNDASGPGASHDRGSQPIERLNGSFTKRLTSTQVKVWSIGVPCSSAAMEAEQEVLACHADRLQPTEGGVRRDNTREQLTVRKHYRRRQ
jgi:hypothetical protein